MNSAEKVAALLRILGQEPYAHSVTSLGEKIGCGKSGAYKLLSVLVQNGLAAQTADHKYTLGPAVYILGKTYEDKIGLSKLVKPYLVRLRDMTGENASLGMLINGKVNLVYREESLHLVRIVGNVGGERPLHAGAVGKTLGAYQDEEVMRKLLMREPLKRYTSRTVVSPRALLDEYAKIREQGYAISDGEFNSEVIGIGAPIRNGDGDVWAAISVGALRSRMDEAKLEHCIYLVTETASMMSKELLQGGYGGVIS